MEWYKSNGYGETVIEVEKTPTCVFVRKNIKRVSDVVAHWQYDEAKLTHAEFAAYEVAKLAVGGAIDIGGLLCSFGSPESGARANERHEVGDYIIMGERLYIVTADISVGNLIVDGGNVTPTTLQAEIKKLKELTI